MIIPEKIDLQVTRFGDGAKGMALQVARNDRYGIQVDARRETRRAAWTSTWTSDLLPDRGFKTYAELRQALAEATVTVPWKAVVLKVEPKRPGSIGKCYLCRGEYVHQVRVKTGWRKGDEAIVSSCDADLEKVKADPVAAIEARRKWVREHPIKL